MLVIRQFNEFVILIKEMINLKMKEMSNIDFEIFIEVYMYFIDCIFFVYYFRGDMKCILNGCDNIFQRIFFVVGSNIVSLIKDILLNIDLDVKN